MPWDGLPPLHIGIALGRLVGRMVRVVRLGSHQMPLYAHPLDFSQQHLMRNMMRAHPRKRKPPLPLGPLENEAMHRSPGLLISVIDAVLVFPLRKTYTGRNWIHHQALSKRPPLVLKVAYGRTI